VDTARVDYWKGQGAQISERVAFLVKSIVAVAPVAETAA
jgi:ribosomal protein S16